MISNNTKIGRIIYIAAAFALASSFLLLVLEKNQVINLYSKPTEGTAPISEINKIDYSPATPTDNESIEEAKITGSLGGSENQNAEDGTPINVVLTAANQDEPGGPVVVRILLNDVKNGECYIKLIKDTEIVEYKRKVVNAGTYYNCEALDIPSSDLSQGTWLLSVNVISENREGSAEQEIEVVL